MVWVCKHCTRVTELDYFTENSQLCLKMWLLINFLQDTGVHPHERSCLKSDTFAVIWYLVSVLWLQYHNTLGPRLVFSYIFYIWLRTIRLTYISIYFSLITAYGYITCLFAKIIFHINPVLIRNLDNCLNIFWPPNERSNETNDWIL